MQGPVPALTIVRRSANRQPRRAVPRAGARRRRSARSRRTGRRCPRTRARRRCESCTPSTRAARSATGCWMARTRARRRPARPRAAARAGEGLAALARARSTARWIARVHVGLLADASRGSATSCRHRRLPDPVPRPRAAHAAVDESVKLAHKYAHPGAARAREQRAATPGRGEATTIQLAGGRRRGVARRLGLAPAVDRRALARCASVPRRHARCWWPTTAPCPPGLRANTLRTRASS